MTLQAAKAVLLATKNVANVAQRHVKEMPQSTYDEVSDHLEKMTTALMKWVDIEKQAQEAADRVKEELD
ncbi:MAG TPA: hypothetical protein VGS11_10885 [Candidatus Bathyarchaeia archaeon]|nr:hypothetical protein [Candidatus Bathyarchaeia archaeon]